MGVASGDGDNVGLGVGLGVGIGATGGGTADGVALLTTTGCGPEAVGVSRGSIVGSVVGNERPDVGSTDFPDTGIFTAALVTRECSSIVAAIRAPLRHVSMAVAASVRRSDLATGATFLMGYQAPLQQGPGYGWSSGGRRPHEYGFVTIASGLSPVRALHSRLVHRARRGAVTRAAYGRSPRTAAESPMGTSIKPPLFRKLRTPGCVTGRQVVP